MKLRSRYGALRYRVFAVGDVGQCCGLVATAVIVRNL